MEKRRGLQDWHHMLAMISIILLLSFGMDYAFLHFNFIPNPGSLERGLIDNFVQVLFSIASVVFAIIIVVLGYSIIFFRRQTGDDTDARPSRGNVPLEITWTIIPLVIVVVLGFFGARVLDRMTAVNPENSAAQTIFSLGAFIPGEVATTNSTEPELEIDVTASRFLWQFAYPAYNIQNVYQLVVPVNRRIVLKMHSTDVIHSFWVQEWGPKQDLVPGLSPVLRVTPTKIGRYLIQCSQLCGFGHTDMTGPVQVVSETDFSSWVNQQQSSSTTSSPPPGTHVMFDLVAQNKSFDKDTLTVPNNVEVMINFENEDIGVKQNFAIYSDSAPNQPIFVGDAVTGPERVMYTFNAPPPGSYIFRCDIFPDLMNGKFIVK